MNAIATSMDKNIQNLFVKLKNKFFVLKSKKMRKKD